MQLLAEILLHAVLRHHFKSEPIACKLFYASASGTKTFGNAHILHGNEGDELWLGRASITTASLYDSVVDSIMTEISHVLDQDFLKEEREVIVTLREPQHLLSTTIDSVLKRHAPIDDLIQSLCLPVLIAYDSGVLNNGFAEDYRTKLITEVTERYIHLKAILPAVVTSIRVHMFLIPVECTATLTQQFSQKIGSH